METQKVLLKYTCPDISDMVLDYAFKCDEDTEYFELGYYEKCKELKEYNPSTALYYSCVGGYIEIIELAIRYCDTNFSYYTDWNSGLCGACYNGNMDIVNLMIKKGATDWTSALLYAYTANNLEATKLMCEKGADPSAPNVQCPAYFGTREIDKVVMKRYFGLYDI